MWTDSVVLTCHHLKIIFCRKAQTSRILIKSGMLKLAFASSLNLCKFHFYFCCLFTHIFTLIVTQSTSWMLRCVVACGQVEHLKALLLTGRVTVPGSPSGGTASPHRSTSKWSETDAAVAEAVERERQLAAALIRSVEQERNELRLRQDEFGHALRCYESENYELRERINELQELLRAAEQKTTATVANGNDERLNLVGVTMRKKNSVEKESV